MTFDLTAFKKEWRELAEMAGVDPVEGATSFQVVAWKAAWAKQTHNTRMAALVRAHAARHPELAADEYDDLRRALFRRARPDWWKLSELWLDPGWSASTTESGCYTRLYWAAWRHEIRLATDAAARRHERIRLRPLRLIYRLPVTEPPTTKYPLFLLTNREVAVR
jgi:hypothetical protein